METGGRFTAGERVGSFRLVAPLGEGAMARVWRAEGPGGPVAIKLLNLEGPGVRERFEQEARALLKLRHEHVVRALDYAHAADGTPFMAMELLQGESLEDRLVREGRIGVEEAVAIACAAAAGLGAAHAIGLVHRDVKPGNLFLCRDGGVKVLDFGIAFWTENDGRMPVSRLTAPGTLMGTPSYMAPEQAAGERDEDARTDVWGLGAVLYHAIAGREPFRVAGNYLGELTRILTEPPDPLPQEIPKRVVKALERALSKPRDARFGSMAEMMSALSGGEPLEGGDRPSNVEVMGALADEVRLVSAALLEDLAEEAHDAFMAAVRRHGALGSPLLGNRAVAIFGGDEWLGDEAERAVRMALEIRPHTRRIAIGTGKAVRSVGQRGMVTGQAVAAAQGALQSGGSKVETLRPPSPSGLGAALEAPAPVLVCPDTARRLQGGYMVVGARVVGPRIGGRTLRPREVAGREVPFVGRQQELDDLVDFVEEILEERRAASLVILGPPGIGKSRLRFELLRWIAEQRLEVRQLEARGELAHGHLSLGVMRELLRGHAGLPEGTDAAAGRSKIEALVAAAGLSGETAVDVTHFIGELLGVPFASTPSLDAARADPQLMADRIRMACRQLFDAWTSQGLVLVSIEDAQWADPASLALLDALRTQLADRPLAVIATARPAFVAEHAELEGAELIELGELSVRDTAAIVERVLGRPEPRVAERAAGNPYLAEELSLAVREGADPDALPLTVEGAVLARLDKLARDEKDLLKRAAVLGRRFWSQALEALGEPDANKLLGALRRRELVIPRAETRHEGCDEWIFRQAIVYEVCRGLLTDEQRARLHKAAASWLSRRLDAAPDEVATHFSLAGDAQRALLWWMRAMHAARRRGDSRNVITYSDRVLELAASTGLPPSEALALCLLRAEAWFWLGDQTALERELVSTARLADEHGPSLSPAALAELRRWQAEHVQRSGHLEPALFAAREAVRLSDASRALDLRVRTRSTLAGALATSGSLHGAKAAASEALEVAKQGAGSMIRATAARALANVELERGELASALFYFTMARNLCLEVGGLREATASGIGVGSALLLLGEYGQAERMLDKTLATAEALDLGHIRGRAQQQLALLQLARGHEDRALALLVEAEALSRELDDVPLAIAAAETRSILERETGNLEASLAGAERALAWAARHGLRPAEPRGRVLAARALVRLSRAPEALEQCRRAAAIAEEMGGLPQLELELHLTEHDALVGLGRAAEALAALERAHRSFAAQRARIDSASLRATYTARFARHPRLADRLSGEA